MQLQRCNACGYKGTVNRERPGPCHLSLGGPCDSCTKLNLLDAEILETERRLENLLKQRNEVLMMEVNTRHDPFARKLPVEIVSRIFEAVWDDEEDEDENGDIELPVFLGGVCQAWRRIARSTPLLWSSFAIDIPPVRWETELGFLKDYIKLSGSLPLSIALSAETPSKDLSIYDPFIEAVNACSDRWNFLELELPAPLLERFCGRDTPPLGAPNLELLVLEATDIPLAPQETAQFSLGSAKPSPIEINFRIPPENLNIDWSRLTLVSMAKLHMTHVFDTLLRVPMVKECILDIDRRSAEVTLPPPSTLTRSIHILDLCLYCAEEDVQFLFDNLTLPSLDDLTVSSYHRHNQLPVNNFLSFLSRSSCRVTKLTLEQPYLTVGDLVEILSASPSLKEVTATLDTSTPLDLLFDCLTAPGDNSQQPFATFLPALATLHVTGLVDSWDSVLLLCIPEAFSLDGGRQSLSVFEVNCVQELPDHICHDISHEFYPYILQRRANGMDIKLNRITEGGKTTDLVSVSDARQV